MPERKACLGLAPRCLLSGGAACSPMFPLPVQVLLQTSPYHVDSLLQLSDACRFQEDQEMARDLVGERALPGYASGPRMPSPGGGGCRSCCL